MEFNVRAGLTGTIETRVTSKTTAIEFGSGSIDVLATPAMIGLMEHAALSSVELHLPAGYTTVGTDVSIKHIA